MSCEGLSLDAATFVSIYGKAWNVFVANYAQRDVVEEALRCFISLSCEGLSPDATTFVVVYEIAWNVFMEQLAN